MVMVTAQKHSIAKQVMRIIGVWNLIVLKQGNQS
jgi:hypothetical protein